MTKLADSRRAKGAIAAPHNDKSAKNAAPQNAAQAMTAAR
jgi:hypothetical protein